MTGDARRWLPTGAAGWWAIAATALLTALAAALVATLWWGASHRADERLLPGTAIADVEVGGLTADAASDRVASHLDAQLSRTVVLEHDGRSWSSSLAELGATTDLDQVVDAALARLDEASLVTLAQARAGSEAAEHHLDVDVSLPEEALERLIARIAGDVDRDADDAAIVWADGTVEVRASQQGERVDRAAAAALLERLLFEDGDAELTAALPVDVVDPQVTTAAADLAAEAGTAAIDRTLDRPIVLTLDEHRWETSARELGAEPDTEPVLETALELASEQDVVAEGTPADEEHAGPVGLDHAGGELAVPLDVDDEALSDLVASVAADIDQPARNADVSWNGSRPVVSPAQTGRALDREAAAARLEEVLAAASDHGRDDGHDATTIELATYETSPAVTSAAFQQVVVLHQSRREVELWRGGEVVRSWPVAVGTGGSPTPTGSFSVGAKRFEPTWVNPAPDRWGEDMPERIGPGPDNPLGVRALNWNRLGGGDTLIRFHGTPNEASIGEAASNGCVRMFNADVIELYDLVPSGTRILSLG